MAVLVSYTVINFQEDTGIIEVYIPEIEETFAIEVPIENGKYIEGDYLLDFIRGFIPVDRLIRKQQLAEGVINAGMFEQFITDNSDDAIAAQAMRKRRDMTLAKTDYLMLADVASTTTSVNHAAFVVYRQQLRDVPQQKGFPLDIKWPTVTGQWDNHPEIKEVASYAELRD